MLSLRDFVPPIAASFYRRLRQRNGASGPPLYQSFEAAARACEGFGYEDDMLVRSLRLKTESYRDACRREPPRLWPAESLLVAAVGLVGKREVTVLDYGGGPGRHYFALRTVLPPSLALRWHVVETPGMAREAASLRTSEMAVFASLPDALRDFGTPDVVFSSGALQCVPTPDRTLQELCALGAGWLVFGRAAVAIGAERIIIVQESRLSWNGGVGLPAGIQDRVVKYPLIHITKKEFDSSLTGRYRVAAILEDETGVETSIRERVVGFSLLAQSIG